MPNKQQITMFQRGLGALSLHTDSTPYFTLLDLLEKWNKAKNLTAITSYSDMIGKHLLDSLSIAPFVTGERILDVGTGPGFPGLPLALYYPNKQFHLCDSNGKKIAFIREAIRVLNLNNVTLVNERIEQYAPPELFDCIISRAFSSLSDMIEKTSHLRASNGQWLAMKGQLHEDELTDISANFEVKAHELTVPFVEGDRHAIEIN